MASESPPPPPDPHRFRPSPRCGSSSSSSSPPRPSLRRAKTLANPESPRRWRREPLVDVTNRVLGAEAREHYGRLHLTSVLCDPSQRLPSLEPSWPDDATGDSPETPSRVLTHRMNLRRTRSAMPTTSFEDSSSPSRPAAAVPALPDEGLASPTAATTRELRPRTRPAITTQSSMRRATRLPAEGGSGSHAPAPAATSVPLSRRRTFGGLETMPMVREDAESAPSRPTTPLTRSRSEAGLDVGSRSDPAETPAEGPRRLRRRQTMDPSSSSTAPSSSPPTSLSRSTQRKGLR
ncbi:hypothetical protein JCM8202_001376 [Rhodotorula sphaerocarpa]